MNQPLNFIPEPNRNQHFMRRDTIFYQIFQQIPTLLFTLLAEPPAEASQYIFDAIEVKETGFRIDGVFLPPNSDGTVYFCEVQFQLDEVLYERMNAEIWYFRLAQQGMLR